MKAIPERMFHLKAHGASVRTEINAGFVTFLTMAYIVVVNPTILKGAGMPFAGVLLATVLVTTVSSVAMGLYANLPYAVAPGMGINAFFAYNLVGTMGIAWETALAGVFISGVVFMVLSITGIRTQIVKAIPDALRLGMAAGIGVFLSLIGLKAVGFVVPSKATTVAFGGLNPATVLFVIGLVGTAVLMVKRVRGALTISIIGMAVLTVIVSKLGMDTGVIHAPLVHVPDRIFSMPTGECLFRLDITAALKLGMVLPVFMLLFVDLFNSIGTFVGLAEVAGFVEKDGTPIRVGRALLVDAFSSAISGLLGTSPGTAFVESASGIREGGRTGLTAVVTGLLFLPFMFLSPLLSFVPAVATAPVLVMVGLFMIEPLAAIDWSDIETALPGFICFLLIPLTFSITQGVMWGFLSFTAIKLCVGKRRQIHWMVYIIDVFILLDLIAK